MKTVTNLSPFQQKRLPRTNETVVEALTDSQLAEHYFIPQYDLHVMPDQAFLYAAEGRLHFDVEGARESFESLKAGVFIHPWHKYPIKTALKSTQVVNKTAKDIYALTDGSKTGKEVYRSLLNKYGEPDGKHEAATFNFFRGMVSRGHVILSDQPGAPVGKRTGSDDYYVPVNVSVETTANCNIKCLHCYGTFEQSRFDAIETTELLKGLEQMKRQGLRVVELTGGECTTHPEFPKILEWCAANFDLVAVLTNGVVIREEIFDIVSKNVHNVVVQICINGNQEYHDYFTKARNSYKRAMGSLRRFAEMGVFLRTPMNLCEENVDQIEETCEAVREAGSGLFIANFVDSSYGRAQDIKPKDHSEGGETHTEETCGVARRFKMMEAFASTVDMLVKKYPEYVKLEYDGDLKKQIEYDKSCGAGKRSLYIASNGRVGLCPMSVETGIPGYGVLSAENGLDECVSSEFAIHMSNLPAPNPKDCAGCPHELEHRGCILQGIRQAMKTPDTCHWGKIHNIAKLVENGYHTLGKNADGTYEIPEVSCGSGCGGKGGGKKLVQISMPSAN